MEEKILIKSECYNVKKLFKVLGIIGVILTVIYSLKFISNSIDYYDRDLILMNTTKIVISMNIGMIIMKTTILVV